MMLGLSLAAFTTLHVVSSLVAIVTGLIAMAATARGHWLAVTTQVFLWTTFATTITGFLFPIKGFTPALAFGILSTVVMAAAFWALYAAKLQGRARAVYVVTAMFALYLNLFVLVVQGFLKIPALHALAPKGNEPPFAIAQGVVLIASIALGYYCLRQGRRRVGVSLAA